jgi:hypothetical protein
MNLQETARVAAVRGLMAYGINERMADSIIQRMIANQPEEWDKTIQRVIAGEAKRVRVFAIWNDVSNLNTFLYSGDKESTVAFLFRTLGEVSSGELVPDDVDPVDATVHEVEGYNRIACFDIGVDIRTAVRDSGDAGNDHA